VATMIKARWNPDSLLPNCQLFAQGPCWHKPIIVFIIATKIYSYSLLAFILIHGITEHLNKSSIIDDYLSYRLVCWLFTFVIGSCLEEGAEEFLLKPVKLSDVKRVTDFIMKGEGKKIVKKSQKRSRSDDYSPPSISTVFSSVSHPCDLSLPASPSTLHSKKSRLSL